MARPPAGVAIVPAAALMLLTYGNLTGYRTETGTRFAILAGFAVAVFAVGILLEEDTAQTAGGFSAHALGGVGMLDRAPSLSHRTRLEHHDLRDEVENFTPSEDVIGLLYLVNGILCLFVFEAVRRERVVSVSIRSAASPFSASPSASPRCCCITRSSTCRSISPSPTGRGS